MKFIDEVTIHVKAGDGGPGASHFRREKFVPLGGPDGGNGGRGGSVILKATRDKNTLLDYSFKPIWDAKNGVAGSKQLKDGANGEDVILLVPIGTEVYSENGEFLQDLARDEMEYVLVRGGKGGKGNHSFKSPTNRAPEYAQPGLPGESGSYTLSLKLLADVGLVGLPNAGKSTFISTVSAAKPKIADYPFTTLTPNLGVVKGKGGFTYTVADVPGLIEGAHQGKGLGKDFLKHLERTTLILHLIDVSSASEDEPIESYNIIQSELSSFSDEFAKKEMIVVLTKIDALQDSELLAHWIRIFQELGRECVALSSVTKNGLEHCLDLVTEKVKNSRKLTESSVKLTTS